MGYGGKVFYGISLRSGNLYNPSVASSSFAVLAESGQSYRSRARVATPPLPKKQGLFGDPGGDSSDTLGSLAVGREAQYLFCIWHEKETFPPHPTNLPQSANCPPSPQGEGFFALRKRVMCFAGSGIWRKGFLWYLASLGQFVQSLSRLVVVRCAR